MFEDDDGLGGRKPEAVQDSVPAVLEPLSVEELTAYRDRLAAEMRRIEQEIARKRDHLSAAEEIFKL